MKFREQHLNICNSVFDFWWNELEQASDLHLEPSWIYDLKVDYPKRQYPNHKASGVYIFFTESKILEVGKSKNAVGPQLEHDLKWVLERMEKTDEDSALTTVFIPIIQWQDTEDMALRLEQYLIESLKPDRSPFPFQ